MLKSEFDQRIGKTSTDEEYNVANAVYNRTEMLKDQFCKEWKRMGDDMRNGIAKAMQDIEHYYMTEKSKKQSVPTTTPTTMAEMKRAFENKRNDLTNAFVEWVKDKVYKIVTSPDFVNGITTNGEYQITIRLRDDCDGNEVSITPTYSTIKVSGDFDRLSDDFYGILHQCVSEVLISVYDAYIGQDTQLRRLADGYNCVLVSFK